jgi:putative sterol carrier protein
MADLATFANRSDLVTAVKGKSDAAILSEAESAGVEMILQKIFMGMMMTFDAERAAGRKAIIEYDIGGPGGKRHRYQVNVADGACTIDPEGTARAHVKLVATLPAFLKLSTNTANPLGLMLFRKLKIKGDMRLAGEMKAWFSKRV